MKLHVLAAFAATFALAAGAADAQQKKVRIATEGAYAPWNLMDSAGKLVGFELDLGNDLCRRANLACEWSAQAFDGMIPSLQAGRFDAIMAGMSITPKRLESINFTQPYAGTPTQLAVLKSSPLAGLKVTLDRMDLAEVTPEKQKSIDEMKAQLKGKTVGVQTSTIQAIFLEQYMKGDVTVRQYDTTENMLLDLNAGRVDGALASMSYWLPMLDKDQGKNIALVGPQLRGGVFGKGVGVGLRKGDTELETAFNDALKAAKADGTVKKLSLQWFKFDAALD